MKKLIVANWKMNPQSIAETKRIFSVVKKGIKNIKNVEVVICPPFTALSSIQYQVSSIKLGAQDCFWEEKGAFTGEISPLMLKNLGCEYVIVGHSERRKYLKETDEMINKKIKAAIIAKLKPILCIGETLEERKKGKTFKVLNEQLKRALNHLPTHLLNHLIIAYEPVWAIGTGQACDTLEAKKVILFLRKSLKKTPVLYGGSVNSKNAVSYVKDYNPPTTLPLAKGERAPAAFDGLLIGGASLKRKEFIKIAKAIST